MIKLRSYNIKQYGVVLTFPEIAERFIHSDRTMAKKMVILPGQKVLEVGFCLGQTLKEIIELYPECELHGIDKEPRFVERCSDIKATLICGDALKLPYEDQYFDVAFCNSVFCEMDDDQASQCLSEMRRVAKQVYYSETYEDITFEIFNG